MKRKTVLLLVVVALGLAGGTYGVREYFRGPEDKSSETAVATLTAEQLALEFMNDEASATAKYVGKVVQVTGTVERIEGKDVFLRTNAADNVVRCTFISKPAIKAEDIVAIKGDCGGAIVMIGAEVQLSQCAVVE